MRSEELKRYTLISLAALVLAACANDREPAKKIIDDIQTALHAAPADAAKYAPDQLNEVQAKYEDLQTELAAEDYKGVVARGPAVLAEAQGLTSAATAKKAEVMQQLNDQWSSLSSAVPQEATALRSRIDLLSQKKNLELARRIGQGIDLAAAKAALGDATSLWSKAQGAFGNGNMGEAVSTAKDAKAKLDTLANTPKGRLAGGRRGALGSAGALAAGRACGGERSFADDHRGAANMRRGERAILDLEPHLDLRRTLHVLALEPDESRGVLTELTELEQITGKHGVGVAARRILRDPEGGQNIRDSVVISSGFAPRFTANTKKPSAPSSWPRVRSVSKLGASASSARGSPIGTSSRVLPLRAIRAGMTSWSEVAGSLSASATRRVVLNGSGLSSSGTVCRNSITVELCAPCRLSRALTSTTPIPHA